MAYIDTLPDINKYLTKYILGVHENVDSWYKLYIK